MKTWTLSQAKNRFSEVVKTAMAGEPQFITRRGKAAVVVVSVEEYERLCRLAKVNAPSFVDLLLQIPQDGQEIERMALPPRSVDLCDG